jgi:hypothetical protein
VRGRVPPKRRKLKLWREWEPGQWAAVMAAVIGAAGGIAATLILRLDGQSGLLHRLAANNGSSMPWAGAADEILRVGQG